MKLYSAVKLPEGAQRVLEEAGIEYKMYDTVDTPDPEILKKEIVGVDGLITGINIPVPAEVIELNPDLKVIANVGAGFNNIDTQKAKELGIPVTNTPGGDSEKSTAELAITLMLTISRDFKRAAKLAEANEFIGWQVMGYLGGHQVYGKTLTIVGFGNIGQQIARMVQGFNMEILYVDIEDKETDLAVRRVELDEALEKTDYLILQTTYNEESHHMIGEEELKKMKDTAYLINSSRGGIVDEKALIKALEKGEIAGAALDVHEEEPHINEELIKMENVIVTPHIGNDTYEARNEMAEVAVGQAIKVLKGEKPDYQVN